MDLETAHLRSFNAIVRYGGFHRAAEALHLSQPAVSRHIRLLEQQFGEPLFSRRGRGVELTPFGERAALELGAVLAAHDQALVRLAGEDGTGPFVFGSIDNLFDPVIPSLIPVVREALGERPLQLRIDRSRDLYNRYLAGELDAATVFDPHGHPDAVDLGTLTLWWWTAADRPLGEALPDPFALVAYDAPCCLRDLAFTRLREVGVTAQLTAEAPHLSGVQMATRNGLGAALLASGGDGLRRVSRGPLAQPIQARLWLLVSADHRRLVDQMREVISDAAPASPALTAVA